MNRTNGESIRSVGTAIRELKEDLTGFLRTRVQMLTSEMQEKLAVVKVALPSIAISLIFGLVGLFALTGALVYIISLAIGIGWSLLVVGLFYVIVAGGAAWTAYGELSKGMAPTRTLEVLKQDQAWLQQEARSA